MTTADLSHVPACSYQDGELFVDGVAATTLAQQYGTPSFVYSAKSIRTEIDRLSRAFADVPHKLHYAVKANSNLSILRLCAEAGMGFDIVSGGELLRVLKAGGDPEQVIFSGVGKSVDEIDLALKMQIGCFNVESAAELDRLQSRAQLLGKTAPVSVRVNPDVDPKTHPYISTGLKQNKFGVPGDVALDLYRTTHDSDHLLIKGIDCHIGSQISQYEPLVEALDSLLELVDQLQEMGITLEHIDLGGGMGIRYQDETPLDVTSYGKLVAERLAGRTEHILLEPGRSIVGNAGILLTRVEYTKPGDADAPSFAVADAAMNDLIRPALYDAWHDVLPVQIHDAAPQQWDIVGPICESGDFLARGRSLALAEGDLLAIASAGAYCMVQASNYNSRGRAAEVLVEDGDARLIRRRETFEDQVQLEL